MKITRNFPFITLEKPIKPQGGPLKKSIAFYSKSELEGKTYAKKVAKMDTTTPLYGSEKVSRSREAALS